LKDLKKSEMAMTAMTAMTALTAMAAMTDQTPSLERSGEIWRAAVPGLGEEGLQSVSCGRRRQELDKNLVALHLEPQELRCQKRHQKGNKIPKGANGRPVLGTQPVVTKRLPCRILSQASHCFKMLQDASRCFKMLQDASRCFKMLQDASVVNKFE